MADDFGYHIDHHGSLVRPGALLAARADGDPVVLASVVDAAVDAVVDAAVVAAAHAQRRLGLSAVGDGQFRRDYFESVIYQNVAGFQPAEGVGSPLADAAGIPVARRRRLVADPVALGRLAQAEVAPVLATVDRPVFVVLPSPGYLAALGTDVPDADITRRYGAALAAIIRTEIQALAADGVAYVALGNPLYVPLLTVAGREQLADLDVNVDAALGAMVEADRAVFAGLTVPEDFRVGLDLTDGGPLPTTSLGYAPTALEALLDDTPFRRLCVDFPAEPAARLPLDLVKPGLVVSLGVVDVSVASLEPVEALLERLDPVVDERGESDIAVATNGGFAPAADGGRLTEDEQRAKLRLVETVARYCWGNEI
jgi:5-methyltetrahydropteroyltriglutamate--homocysteine methyltransferase